MALLMGTCSIFTLQRPVSPHQKLYPGLCRHLSLQPLTKLKSPAKLRRKWLSASATVCFLYFSIPSIHGPTGLPSLPWAPKHFPLGRPTHSGPKTCPGFHSCPNPLPLSKLFWTSSHSFLFWFCVVFFWPGDYY